MVDSCEEMIHISDAIINHITFGSDDASLAAFRHMLHRVQRTAHPLGSIDFNKLIPMPPELKIECGSRKDAGLKLYREFVAVSSAVSLSTLHAPETVRAAQVTAHLEKWDAKEKADPELWELGKSAFQNIQKYGVPTWYEWSTQHWGTKWNAYQCRPLNDKDDTMEFLTANGSVPRLVAAISRRYPDQEITYRWADENLGHNVGEIVFKNGEQIEMDILPDSSRAAYEMAAELTGIDLASCNLFLTADKSTYEYQENPPPGAQKQKKKARGQGKDR